MTTEQRIEKILDQMPNRLSRAAVLQRLREAGSVEAMRQPEQQWLKYRGLGHVARSRLRALGLVESPPKERKRRARVREVREVREEREVPTGITVADVDRCIRGAKLITDDSGTAMHFELKHPGGVYRAKVSIKI